MPRFGTTIPNKLQVGSGNGHRYGCGFKSKQQGWLVCSAGTITGAGNGTCAARDVTACEARSSGGVTGAISPHVADPSLEPFKRRIIVEGAVGHHIDYVFGNPNVDTLQGASALYVW